MSVYCLWLWVWVLRFKSLLGLCCCWFVFVDGVWYVCSFMVVVVV